MTTHDNFLISLDSTRLGYGPVVLYNPHHDIIPRGITVITGDNGAGKTTLGTILKKGRYAYGNRLTFAPDVNSVLMLSFTDIHTLSGMEAQYYAQRLEATANEMVPTVAEIIGRAIESEHFIRLCDTLNLRDVASKKINQLSSGELRKLLVINALMAEPDMLILDNPYIGLDAGSRREFDATLVELRETGVSVIMLLCDNADIPAYADALIEMKERTLGKTIVYKGEIDRIRTRQQETGSGSVELPEAPAWTQTDFRTAFAIRNGHVRYGDHDILREFDWQVDKGERWLLAGPNGSGKSMLLSLICADNPQAYANDITLFDHQRGTGESIWEIKDAIGYVSPEMQLFFKSGSDVLNIVLQGLRSAMNRYAPATPEETAIARAWLDIMGISHLASRKFSELSTGEQRMVLVSRAMIKQPPLLVLDEPLHGLDSRSKQRVGDVISALMRRPDATMIFVTHYESEIPPCITHRKELTKIKN